MQEVGERQTQKKIMALQMKYKSVFFLPFMQHWLQSLDSASPTTNDTGGEKQICKKGSRNMNVRLGSSQGVQLNCSNLASPK